MKEKLSALVDNELSELEERQVLKELPHNDELKQTWGRYHLMGAALRHESIGLATGDVATRVAQAIRDESLNVGRFSRARIASGFGKAVGGLAIAASVATVAIVSVRPSLVSSTNEMVATNPVYTTVVSKSDVKQADTTKMATMDPLNSYLVEHNEYAPIAGIGGVLPVDFDHAPSQ